MPVERPWVLRDFNPRPLAGATSHKKNKKKGLTDFNPRPLAGATSEGGISMKELVFQSTPPCGGDQAAICNQKLYSYFNPRPLAGATIKGRKRNCPFMISIHAPLRGRPLWMEKTGRLIPISIHAPLRGRRQLGSLPSSTNKFQSTPPCGGDRFFQQVPPCRLISIHAPLRGRHPDINPEYS